MRSWKTTLAGICAIITALASAGTALANGTPVDYPVVVSSVIAGIGLLVAKDANVGGNGTVAP